MEVHPCSSELVIEANTNIIVAAIAQISLVTAAVNRKVDQRSRFLECPTWHLTG